MKLQHIIKLTLITLVTASSAWTSDESSKDDMTIDIEKLDIEAIAHNRPIRNSAYDPLQIPSSSLDNEKNWKLKFDTKNPSEDIQTYFAYEPDSIPHSESLWNKMWSVIGGLFTPNSKTNTEPQDEIKRDIHDEKKLENYLQGGTSGYVPTLPLDLTNVKMMSEEEMQDQRDLWDDAISGPWQYNEYGRPYKFWGEKTTSFPKIQPTIVEKENSVTFIFQNNTKGGLTNDSTCERN